MADNSTANIEIAPEVKQPNTVDSVGQGVTEAGFASALDSASAASPMASVADYPMNKAYDIPAHGTGNPLIDSMLMPVMNRFPHFQQAMLQKEKAPKASLLNNDLTQRLMAGIKAHQYTSKFYPGESLSSLASKAGEAMNADFQINKGMAAASPVNLGASVSRALTTNAWHNVADYAANRIAYHTTRLALPMILGMATGQPEATFGIQGAGAAARQVEQANPHLSPAQKTEAVMMKAGADALFGHYMTALPGIAPKLTPWAEGIMNDMGKGAGPILLEGIKAALEEDIKSSIGKKMLENLINGMANQLLHILVEQHYKLKDWTISQAILAIAQSGGFAALVGGIMHAPFLAARNLGINNQLPTYEELQGAKQILEGYINGIADATVPHVTDIEMVKKLSDVDYMLKNGLWRDSNRVYKTLGGFTRHFKNEKGFARVSKGENYDTIKYSGMSDEQLKAQGISQEEIDKVRNEEEPAPGVGESKMNKLIGKEGQTEEGKDLKIKMAAEEKAAKYGYQAGWQEASKEIKELVVNSHWQEAQNKLITEWREAKLKHESQEKIDALEEKIQQHKDNLKESKANIAWQDAQNKLISEWKEAELKGASQEKIDALKEKIKENEYKNRWKEAEGNTARDKITKYLNDYAPAPVRGKFTTAIRDAKDPQELAKVFSRIDSSVETFNKSLMIKNLKKLTDKVLNSGSIAVEYKQHIADVMKDFSYVTPSSERLEKLNSLKDYINKMEDAGQDTTLPSYLFDSLKVLGQKPLGSMTSNEIKNLYDKIDLLGQLGKTKLASRKALYEGEKAQVMENIRGADLNKLEYNEPKKSDEVGSKPGAIEKMLDKVAAGKEYMRLANKAMLPMQHLFDWFGDTLTQNFKTPIDTNWGVFQERVNGLHDEVMSKIESLGLKDSHLERVGAWGALQQEGGREKLLNHYTEKALDDLKLTPEETKFYNFMRKSLDQVRPDLERFMRDVHNQPLGKIANYFPFHTDWSLTNNAEIQERLQQLPKFDQVQKKNVNLKFSKERTDYKGVQKIKVNAADVFLNHMENVYYALEMGKTVKQLQELAGTPEFGEKIGGMGQQMIKEWLDLIARKGGPRGADYNAAWHFINGIRKNIGVSMLGFNPSTILIHLLPVIQGSGVIGQHAFKGFGAVSTSAEWRNFVLDNSPEVRNRLGGDDPAYREFGKNWWEKVQGASLKPITAVNGHSAAGVWAGAYIKNLEEREANINLNDPDSEAKEYAEKVVKETQSSGMAKDAPLLLSRGTGMADSRNLAKMIFQFSTPMFYRYGLVSEMAPKLWAEGKRAEAANVIVSQLANAAGEMAIRHGTKIALAAIGTLLFGAGQEASKNQKPVWQEYVRDVLKTYPIFSTLMDTVDYGTMPGAIFSEIESTLKDIQIAKNAVHAETKMKWAIISGIKVASLSLGIPAGNKIASFAQHHLEGYSNDMGGKLDAESKKMGLDFGGGDMDKEWKKFQKESGF